MPLRRQNYLRGTELPSNNQITLLIDWKSLIFVGFARIGRVLLSVEGVIVVHFSWWCLFT